MQQTITELEAIITKYGSMLRSASKDMEAKPSPEKWSKKETIGHLIDSAQNNLRRFIIGQYEEQPLIVYRQDDWVKMNDYQNAATEDLITLWQLLNKQLVMILRKIPVEKQKNICVSEQPHTIEWLAADYNKHLLHHLHQILDLEPVVYP